MAYQNKKCSIKFSTNCLYLVLILQVSSYVLVDCAAFESVKLSKDEGIVTSTSSSSLNHVIKVEDLDSNSKITESGTDMHHKELENSRYIVKNNMENNQKENNLEHFIDGNSDVKQNIGKEVPSSKRTMEFSELIASKLATALKKQLRHLFSRNFPKYSIKSNSSEMASHFTSELNAANSKNISNNSIKKSDEISSSDLNKKVPTARQFVFHPFLPYDKDVMPDEKISIEDVLPVKMVKFFKGMVEDAPWEQMFQKMVRMIVDQFVDKIIEKMFAHKEDEHDKWRSLDSDSAKPSWSLAKNVFSLIRPRRSTEGKTKSEFEQDRIEKDLTSANRVSKEDRSKTKEPPKEEPWLDSILDFLFPDDPKAVDSEENRRKRRDSTDPLQDNKNQMTGIMRSFLARYLKFHSEQTTPDNTNTIVKDSNPNKMSEVISQDNSTDNNSELSVSDKTSSSINAVSNTARESKLTDLFDVPSKPILRSKRSTTDDTDKDKEEERLWQANRRIRPSNRKSRDDCSLRRACNAGRLLSRLPSVQDITMQLKTYGNEPHWDALLWGMTKKRCSRIFCKRQRSPKGTKQHWDGPEKRLHRKGTPSPRDSRLRYDESDLTTIFPV